MISIDGERTVHFAIVLFISQMTVHLSRIHSNTCVAFLGVKLMRDYCISFEIHCQFFISFSGNIIFKDNLFITLRHIRLASFQVCVGTATGWAQFQQPAHNRSHQLALWGELIRIHALYKNLNSSLHIFWVTALGLFSSRIFVRISCVKLF